MSYREQRRFRQLPPVIVAILLAFVAVHVAVSTLSSEAVDYIEPEAGEIRLTATPTVLDASAYDAPEATPATKEPTQPGNGYQSIIGSRDWDAEENQILLKIAMAEAEGETVEGKALVMLVVLNRVWSNGFPDTIEKVVFQKGQFSPTVTGGRYWTTEPDEGCYEALALVLSGWDESNGALYFESCKGDSWHSRNLELVLEYGNHRFYK